jgi:hypothetical protein
VLGPPVFLPAEADDGDVVVKRDNQFTSLFNSDFFSSLHILYTLYYCDNRDTEELLEKKAREKERGRMSAECSADVLEGEHLGAVFKHCLHLSSELPKLRPGSDEQRVRQRTDGDREGRGGRKGRQRRKRVCVCVENKERDCVCVCVC